MLNTSRPMIARLRAGTVSSVPMLLKAIEQFGVRILEPVIGRFDDESLARRLDAIEGLLKEVRYARPQSSADAQASYRDVGAGRGGHDGGGQSHPGVVPAQGSVVHETREGSAVALIETRRDINSLTGREGEALRRHLTALDNVVSLDRVRELAKSDNRRTTGLAYRRSGEDWTILPAGENRLWMPSSNPRRVTDFEGDANALRRDLDEVTRASRPIVAVHAGAFMRGGELLNFNSTVVRLGGKSKCGADLVLTDFVRRGIAA